MVNTSILLVSSSNRQIHKMTNVTEARFGGQIVQKY